jgi:hypothetical protein
MMRTVAYRSLSPNGRAAYLEVYFGFDGENNGDILLSTQMLADRLNRDKSTAARALKELEQLGFIRCMTKGGFSCKIPHASKWRLTAFRCNVTGELPSKEFMQWQPENPERGGTGEAHGGTGATDGLKTTRNSPSQWHRCNREGQFEGVSGGTGATYLNSNHTVAVPQRCRAAMEYEGSRDVFVPLGSVAIKSLLHLDRSLPAEFRSWAPLITAPQKNLVHEAA